MNIRTRSIFRREGNGRRYASGLTAAAMAALLVLGGGTAFADDAPSDPAAVPADLAPPAPADDPAPAGDPAGAPADIPAPDPAPTNDPAPEPEPSADPEPSAPAEESGDEAAEDSAAAASAVAPTRAVALTSALAAFAIPCSAAPSDDTGGWEIDGNICTQGVGLDWDITGTSVEDGFGDGTTFHGGNSEGDDPATWSLGGPTPNGKTDIGTAWAYSHIFGGDVWGFFALTNDSTSGGTSQYDVEYNQADPINGMPNRTPGDLLFRFSSTGSDPISFDDAKMWRLKTDPDWDAAKCQAITATAGWCTIPKPAGSFDQSVSTDGTFFEGALNISLLVGPGNCTGNFGVVNIRSVTGNSFYSSALKDYVTPIGVDTPSNCGKIVINKKDENGVALGGAHFTVSPNPDPDLANGVAYSITDNDANDTDPADGVIVIDPVDPDDTYTVTEVAPAPTGYMIDNPLGTSTNPQHIGVGETATFNFVDHKIWAPLTISKTATPSYAASYDWSIVKEIAATANGPWSSATTANDPLDKEVADGTADQNKLFYRVKVTQGAETTTDYQVAGTITVGNTNTAAVNATLGDALPGGTCTIAGHTVPYNVSVPAGGAAYAYVCDLGDDPAPADITGQKTNTATVAWSRADYPQVPNDLNGGTFSENATANYTFGAPTSTEDKSVTIEDDKTNALDGITLDWTAEGTVYTSDVYSTSHTVDAGSCTDVIENTASVIGDGDDVLDSDSAYGKICIGADLTISGIDAETLVRTYPWSVEKSTSTPKVYVKDGKATADYKVIVTAGDGVDSAWNITGTITVDNPNDWESVDVTSLPVSYTGGGTCAVTGAVFPVTIAADDDTEFTFSCNFNSKPDYDGTINATVNWDAAAAKTPTGSDSAGLPVAEADWGKTLVNDTVTVTDDNATPGDTSDDTDTELEWSSVYAEDDHQHVITYSVEVTGDDLPEIGTCENRVNTVQVVGDNDVVLDADNDLENNSATVEICNPYTQIQALKVDYETGEPLAGAEFSLFEGPDASGTAIGTATSDANGIALFDNKLLPGTYTVKETKAPEDHTLPINGEDTVTVTIDHIEDEGSNFVENGVMAPITFRDPATGEITLAKEHFERDPATNDWVVSDDAVDFGQEIRYVITVNVTGAKLFHDTTVTDYVPGTNPLDGTSTGDGVLVAGSATCSGAFSCTAIEDPVTGKITWTLTTAGQDEGTVKGDATGTVEYVVTMPELPDEPPFVDGVFSVLLWNAATLDWNELVVPPTGEDETEDKSLTSNEVKDEAQFLEPSAEPTCEDPNPPASLDCIDEVDTPLPDTGGPSFALLLLGLGLALGGTGLVAVERRQRRRS